MFRIHRLIGEAYIPNPQAFPIINHKDLCKDHNFINNLEWCDYVYNNNYKNKNKTISKMIYCEELNRTFESACVASRELGISRSGISKCCCGTQKTAGGYHWRYANELLGEETGGNSREVIE